MRSATVFAYAVLLASVVCAQPHVLKMDYPVSEPEEGFVLGNGDLSVCAYQTMDAIVFRFGKGDVWDRRMEYETNRPPCTVRDYIDGAFGRKDWSQWRKSDRGVSMPFPCPKPVGELKVHIPSNLPGVPRWRQELHIEDGCLRIAAEWKNGVKVGVEAVVDSEKNEFAMKWKCLGWNDMTKAGRGEPPVFFSLERDADPQVRDFMDRVMTEGFSVSPFPGKNRDRDACEIEPLPPPTMIFDPTNNFYAIDQDFYPCNLFPDGFKCRMQMCVGRDWGRAEKVGPNGRKQMLRFFGWSRDVSGSMVVRVTTTRDVQTGKAEWAERGECPRKFASYAEAAKRAAGDYWAKSSFSVPGDRELEDLWYATFHLRRCFLKGGTVPPGLFHPCSLRDYSIWHGDYHMNYNMESIYWGDFTANHPEQAEAYFDCVDFARPMGRKVAKEAYGCRGCFMQLEQFPVLASRDYNGSIPLGRMVYMTGWAMSRFWEYYTMTLDRDFLEKRGYPFIKECALFYLDFLKKAPHPDLPPELKDGKYHVFPSIAGEANIKPCELMKLCDQWSPIAFSRHCLWAAAQASEILGVDEDLRTQWKDRYENLAGESFAAKGYARHCLFSSPPEYCGHPYMTPAKWDGKPVTRKNRQFWYFGLDIRDWMSALRQNRFIPERDWPHYRYLLVFWSRPNGAVRAMSVQHYGRTGGWTETLSCMAPVQETLLQSWDGAIRLFPYWLKTNDVAFADWRATGAFLVDAEIKGGKTLPVGIVSEKGADCHVWGEWTVTDADGKHVPTDHDEFGRMRFKTVVGGRYRLIGK